MILNEQSAPAFDRESALSRVGGDLDLLREVGALFLKESVPAVSELRRAVAARDAFGIEHKAHELKGSIATFGVGEPFQFALDIEQRGKTGNLEQVDGLMERFEHSLDRLCTELRELVG